MRTLSRRDAENRRGMTTKHRILMELAAVINRLSDSSAQATVVSGTDDERTGLFIDGKSTVHLLQLKPEIRQGTDQPNGKVRLNVGELGKRRSFRQRGDGGYNYDRAASLLVVLMGTGNPVVLQLSGNDDSFRLIEHDTLREVARLGRVAVKRLWEQSKPAQISSTNQVDYTLVTDDEESWDDLRQVFKEEEDES